MLTHYEDFWGKLAENMQARCANSFQRDLFSVSLKVIPLIGFEIPKVKSFIVYNEKTKLLNEKFIDELYRL